MSEKRRDTRRDVSQTPEYLGGFLDALKQREAHEQPLRLPAWRFSDDSGIPITVTQPDDPAYALLQDAYTTSPTVYRKGCYICEDPEFAQMGLPLCRRCPSCGGHIAADAVACDDCGFDEEEAYLASFFELLTPQSVCRGDK